MPTLSDRRAIVCPTCRNEYVANENPEHYYAVETALQPQPSIVVAITSHQYWGKGKDVEDALAQCRKAGASGSQNVLLYTYTGPQEKLDEVTVNSMGDIEYPQSCASVRIGMIKLNVNQPKLKTPA